MTRLNIIDGFIVSLEQQWKKYFSDYHFGRFVMDFFKWISDEKGYDPAVLNEEQMSACLEEYCINYSSNHEPKPSYHLCPNCHKFWSDINRIPSQCPYCYPEVK